MYNFTTILCFSLLGALLLFGRRGAAAEASIPVWSWQTSTSTTFNGHTGTITEAAASSITSVIVDQQGSLLTITPSELTVSRSVCASWLDPESHSTIYERCNGGEECMLIAFPEDSSPSDIYDLVSLVGCSYSTLPPITTMYPYGHAPSTGCWESAFGCCSKNEPYNIVLTTADNHAAMFACATGNYGSLPVLGFEWNTGTTLTRENPLSAAAAASSRLSATLTGASSTPGSATTPVSSAPPILPSITPPPQGATSPTLGGRSKAGIAVGSIIGGGALLAFAAVLLLRCRKRRREQQRPPSSFGGLENADDYGNGHNPDQTGQAAQPMLPGRLVSELDTKNATEQLSGMPSVGRTVVAGSSPGRTVVAGSSAETKELAGSSPTTAELTGSPIITLTSPGSESPVLPHHPLGSHGVVE